MKKSFYFRIISAGIKGNCFDTQSKKFWFIFIRIQNTCVLVYHGHGITLVVLSLIGDLIQLRHYICVFMTAVLSGVKHFGVRFCLFGIDFGERSVGAAAEERTAGRNWKSKFREEIIFVFRASSSLPKAAFKCSKESIFSAGNARDTHGRGVSTRVSKCSDRSSKFSYRRGLGDKKTEISTVMSRRGSTI